MLGFGCVTTSPQWLQLDDYSKSFIQYLWPQHEESQPIIPASCWHETSAVGQICRLLTTKVSQLALDSLDLVLYMKGDVLKHRPLRP
jgi:hypothetical protein